MTEPLESVVATINIDLTSPKMVNSDPIANEPPGSIDSWTSSVEDFIKNIRNESRVKMGEHTSWGYRKKQLNIIFVLPGIIIPAFMTPIAGNFKDTEWIKLLSPLVFAFVAVSVSLSAYFGFAKKSEQHFNYSAKYSDLVTDIDEELCKIHSVRREARVFMAAIKSRFDSLNTYSPNE